MLVRRADHERLRGCGGEDSHRAVGAAGGQPLPRGVVGDVADDRPVAREFPEGSAAPGLPQPHEAVAAGRGEAAAARVESHLRDAVAVGERRDQFPGIGPEPGLAVVVAGHAPLPIGADGDRPDRREAAGKGFACERGDRLLDGRPEAAQFDR